MLDAIDAVRASEGWLHLEVVGGPSEHGLKTAAGVAAYLKEQGAQHIYRGEVWDAGGQPGWRVTGLVAARTITSCRSRLFALGASRVVGLPARFVFDRDGTSTFDTLQKVLLDSGRLVPGPETILDADRPS